MCAFTLSCVHSLLPQAPFSSHFLLIFLSVFLFFFLFSSPPAHATANSLTRICGLGIWMSQVNRTFSSPFPTLAALKTVQPSFQDTNCADLAWSTSSAGLFLTLSHFFFFSLLQVSFISTRDLVCPRSYMLRLLTMDALYNCTYKQVGEI